MADIKYAYILYYDGDNVGATYPVFSPWTRLEWAMGELERLSAYGAKLAEHYGHGYLSVMAWPVDGIGNAIMSPTASMPTVDPQANLWAVTHPTQVAARPDWTTWPVSSLWTSLEDANKAAKEDSGIVVPWSLNIRYDGIFNAAVTEADLAGKVTESGGMRAAAENVCASAVVELGAGWALGVLKIGQNLVNVDHFAINVQRIGPVSDLEKFWIANAGKVNWDDGIHDTDDADDVNQ
jgi:hypothetical protein